MVGQASRWLRRTTDGYAHWCPGCEGMHVINTDAPNHKGAQWTFDGNLTAPTFGPSINIRTGRFAEPEPGAPPWSWDEAEWGPDPSSICHYFLKGGVLQFCGDSTHALSGKVDIPLPPLPPAHCDGYNPPDPTPASPAPIAPAPAPRVDVVRPAAPVQRPLPQGAGWWGPWSAPR